MTTIETSTPRVWRTSRRRRRFAVPVARPRRRRTASVLAEQDDGWYYKRNLSPISTVKENGKEKVVARFEPLIEVAHEPAIAGSSARHQFLDLAGDGKLDRGPVREASMPVSLSAPRMSEWETFIPFARRRISTGTIPI